MKISLIKIGLGLVIALLAVLIFRSVNAPVKFEQRLTERGQSVILRLKEIRTAQMLFRNANGHYTSSFDSLKNFILSGSIPVVRMVPDPDDSTFTRTITDTIGLVSIKDSLFSGTDHALETLDEIPFSAGEKFMLLAGKINKGGVEVSVFEVSAPLQSYAGGLNKQLVLNKVKELEDKNKYPGLKVGSMFEATVDGSWE